MPSAIEVSSVIGLIAVGVLTANILLGLLVSTGYNPVRRWPRRRIKLFLFHKWTGYTALAIAALHPSIILLSSTAQFRFYIHGILADPLLQNRPVDWIDAEKVYVELCLLLVAGLTMWRVTYGRRRRARPASVH